MERKSLETRREVFRDVLKGKELSIGKIAKEMAVRRETVSRWVSFFEMEGFLSTHFNGLKKMVRLNGEYK